MCSFAKFLALGLIASEGRGPVFADAVTTAEYKSIWGMASEYTEAGDEGNELRRHVLCVKLNEAHKAEKGTYPNPKFRQACTTNDLNSYKTAMIDIWKKEAEALKLEPPLSGWLLDSPKHTNNIKMAIIKKLKDDFISVSGSHAVPHSASTPYYTQIKDLRHGITDATKKLSIIFFQGMEVAKNAKLIAEKALQNNSNMKLRDEAERTRDAAKKLLDDHAVKSSYAGNEELLKQATTLETDAKAILAQVERERAEAVGGFFAVLAGLAIAFVALLFSPCFQYDFKNHAFDWEENYKRPEYYNDLKGDARHWRNKVHEDLGLPEELAPKKPAGKVDSAKASSSALTLVPVVVLAGGVFAVARRGLNKRRAQKKAKRASRAQVKLHEDL